MQSLTQIKIAELPYTLMNASVNYKNHYVNRNYPGEVIGDFGLRIADLRGHGVGEKRRGDAATRRRGEEGKRQRAEGRRQKKDGGLFVSCPLPKRHRAESMGQRVGGALRSRLEANAAGSRQMTARSRGSSQAKAQSLDSGVLEGEYVPL